MELTVANLSDRRLLADLGRAHDFLRAVADFVAGCFAAVERLVVAFGAVPSGCVMLMGATMRSKSSSDTPLFSLAPSMMNSLKWSHMSTMIKTECS